MDIVPALPLDLLAVAAPQGGARSGFLRPGHTDGDAVALLPFDALLAQLLAEPPPAGETLPETGNGLPLLPGVLPMPGVPVPHSPEPQPMVSAAPQPSALGAQGLPFTAPVVDAALSLPQSAADPAPSLAARSMQGPLPTTTGEQALQSAEQPTVAADGATTVDADGATTVAADRFSLPADAEVPDARPVHTAPAALDAETQPQPVARVLAALAAAASAPSERGGARATKPAPAGAERASAPVGAERMTLALDAPSDPAPAPRALELPQPVFASDASLTVIEGSRRGEPHLPATPSLAVDAAAPSATFGQSPAPTAAGAPAPTAAPAHAPAAHPHGSVDTTAARWHEALASRIQWVVDHDVGEARIKLNPPELGALDVKISLQDDKTFVQLTAASSAARDELTQSLPRLRELLSANGLELGGATVSGGRDQRSAPYAQAERFVEDLDAGAAIAATELRRARAASSSQIDVFA